MADNLSEILNGASGPDLSSATPASPVPGGDDLTKILHGDTNPAIPAPAEISGSVKNLLQTGEERGLLETTGSGLARGWGQLKATVPSLQAVYKEYNGDLPGAIEKANEAEAIQKPYGESDWNLQNIHSPGDFGYWLTEKMGEQGVNLATMMATGGAGGMTAKMAAQQLLDKALITNSTARAIQLAGAVAPTYAATTALETANTSQEQFEVSSNQNKLDSSIPITTAPGRSLAAGMAKGALEIMTPLDIGRALITPGKQLGKTTFGGIARVTTEEGLTEGAQEAIDIYARKLADPGYSYFKDGPTLLPSGWGEGMWRLAESTAAGAAVGGIYGAPFVRREQNQENRRDIGEEAPGTRTVVQKEGQPSATLVDSLGSFNPKQDREESGPSIGPISALRQMILKPASQDRTLKDTLNSDPKGDALSINSLLGDLKLQESSRERYLDMLDANTPRYIELGRNADSSRIMTDTEIELHDALNRPQSEKPKWLRVDQSVLQPAAITAHLSDLPEAASERIWFLPNTPQETRFQALQQYDKIQSTFNQDVNPNALVNNVEFNDREKFGKEAYNEVLTKGLRVIPSRGAGFYYNGVIDYKGLPQEEVKTTNRSTEVGWYDPVSKRISTFKGDEAQVGSDVMRNRGGDKVLVAVDINRLNEGDFTRHENGDIELKKAWDGSLIPGIAPSDSQFMAMQQYSAAFPKVRKESFSYIVPSTRSLMEQNKEDPQYLNKLKTEVDKLLPVVDVLFKKLGIDGHIAVEFTKDADIGGPTVFPDIALIRLPVVSSWLFRYANPALAAHDWIMHEVGHLVTYHFWRNLPVEIQDNINYAFNQAVLADRMGISHRIGMMELTSPENRQYWSTLPEFLAEQFRRWATTSKTAQTELEKTFKDGSRKLENYYKEWEKRIGVNAVIDLSEPHYYFSAAMEYLKDYRQEKFKLQQKLRSNTLLSVPQDILDSPVLTGIANQVTAAIESMNPMFPAELRLQLKERLSPGIHSDELVSNAPASYNFNKETNRDFIEMALFALQDEDRPGEASRMYLSHELVHAYERRGLFTQEEIQLLTKEARQNQSKLLPPNAARVITDAYRQMGKEQNIPEHLINGWIQESLEAELRAYYVMQFANQGVAFSEQSKTIFARLMAFIEKLRNYLNNYGFQTKDDLLRAFFKGEMVHRADRTQEQARRADWIGNLQQQLALDENIDSVAPSAIWQKDGMTIKAYYDSEGSKKESAQIYYRWYAGNQRVGELILENEGPKGFSIQWVETANASGMIRVSLSQGQTLQRMILQEAERDLGIKLKMPGYFTDQGFKMARLGAKVGQVDPNLLKLYTPVKMDSGNTAYVSPHFLRKQVAKWGQEVAKASDDPVQHEYAVRQFKAYREAIRKLPEGVWKDPRLEQMFSLKRNNERDEVQGSLLRSGQKADENQLNQSLGFPQDGQTQDAFSSNFALKQKLSQGENARISGLPYDLSAPSTMYSFNIKKIWEWSTGMGNNPRIDKELVNLRHEVDRIGKFTKNFITLRQLATSNEHIIPLQQLIQNEELAGLISNKWLRQAGETVHAWDNGRSPERREAIAKTFFDLTEGKFRPQGDTTERNPNGWDSFLLGAPPVPGGELAKLFRDNKLLAKDWEIIRRVSNDFLGFLKESQDQLAKRLTKKFSTSPQILTQALAKLQLDMAKLQNKPYFPMVRFGEFTIAVRDPEGIHGPRNAVVWASAYGTQRERDAAVKEVRSNYPLSEEITVGRIPLHAVEFAGLPGPLLQELKESILDENGKTPEQVALIQDQKQWIEEFEMLNDPDKTFRKRWLPSKGLPGYSMDAMRVYSHYFQSGSRYLSRLAYMDEMRQNVSALQNRAMNGGFGNYAKPKAIADYASNWLQYYLEGGRDAGKLRAFAALWYLGFSPAAAFMNLTQPLMVTVPKLGADFNIGKSYAAYVKAASFIGNNQYLKGGQDYLKAREEMVRQNYIDVGQGAELAALSEGNNLSKLKAGTKLQSFWRKLNYTGMWMFGAAEHYNREVTMRAAWNLAMENPGVERLQKLDVLKTLEISDLTSRLGMSQKEAIAFLYAKEAISDTQFIYSKASDAPFMRNAAKDFLIFFKYTQNMLWAFGKNGASIHMLLLFAFFYGLKGLPGSEDLNEVLRLISRKIFGYDFDLHGSAREFARGITKGSIFDETGPDLLLNGVSRYGFGMGLLPNGWATPRFDASANGSMGKIIPGFADAMHGINTDKPTNDLIADAAAKAAGAGYGPIFALLHALNDPGTADSKKWANVLLPRFLKAEYKAYRYGVDPQAETNSQGAKIVKFDPTDPMDLATIAAQAFGFQPTDVSRTWEALREVQDIKSVYKARRSMLYVQMDKALQEDSKPAIEDMRKAINEYNKEVVNIDPQFVIKANQLIGSLKQRIQQRAMMESTLAKTKGDIGLTQRVMDLYPGVKAERVK